MPRGSADVGALENGFGARFHLVGDAAPHDVSSDGAAEKCDEVDDVAPGGTDGGGEKGGGDGFLMFGEEPLSAEDEQVSAENGEDVE